MTDLNPTGLPMDRPWKTHNKLKSSQGRKSEDEQPPDLAWNHWRSEGNPSYPSFPVEKRCLLVSVWGCAKTSNQSINTRTGIDIKISPHCRRPFQRPFHQQTQKENLPTVVRRRNAGQNQSQPWRNTDDEGGEAKHKDWRWRNAPQSWRSIEIKISPHYRCPFQRPFHQLAQHRR